MFGCIMFLAATAWSSAGGDKKDSGEKKPDGPPEYYPLQVGNEWHYAVTANGNNTKVVTRISTIETIGDKKYAKLINPSVAVQSEHLFQDDKGVQRARYNNLAVTPPFLLLPTPAKVGAKWKGQFAVEKEKGVHNYSGEIQAEETVAVPAGKFATLRVFIEVEDNGKKVRTTYWFARDVGFVKQTFEAEGLSLLLELEKFEKKK